MSVNDLLVQGAEPLCFLDYYGCGKLDVATASEVIRGVVDGCKQAGCVLSGGETAEMPGMYHSGDYDLAGFAVGAVERELLLPQPTIQAGDLLLGLTSSGLHSNGFSLVRKIVESSGLTYASPCPWGGDHESQSQSAPHSVGEALLVPTRIYVRTLLPAIQRGLIKGMAHITGGGFTENIPRVLPKGLGCFISLDAWRQPPLFRWLMTQGNIAPAEMARTFNNGIGMVLIISEGKLADVTEAIKATGEQDLIVIGGVTTSERVELRGQETWLQ